MRLLKATHENRVIFVDFSENVPIPAKARKTENGRQWKQQSTLTETEPANTFEGVLQIISPLFDEHIICGVRDANPKQLRMKVPENEAFTVEELVKLLNATAT